MIEFNRIYVIESLQEVDEKTGTQLHNDLLRWLEYRYPGFKSVLLEPCNKEDWNEEMASILKDAEQGISPIIHFEIHGSTNKDGLVLASGELVTWYEIRMHLEAINIASRMNLFVSLAVCHGAYLLTQYHLDQRAFCYGVLGSFDVLLVEDLKIRFFEFYQELFDTFSIPKAYQKLLISNPGVQVDYQCISALEIFHRNYRNYILTQVEDPKRVKERALEAAEESGLVLITSTMKEAFQQDFANLLHKTKDEFYQEHSTKFLLLDMFPERRAEFNIPETLGEFMQMEAFPG